MKNENAIDSARLLVLDVKHARIFSITTDGTDITTILEGCGPSPDGIAVDPAKRHIYWTNMGKQSEGSEHFYENDGSIERINFDGSNRTVIVPKGGTFTPKQLALDLENRMIYWCDREGMRVMRVNMDGTNITTLIETGKGDADRMDETKLCVGIAIDVKNGHLYWTQKGPHQGGLGRIFRAGLELPTGANPFHRNDIEVLFENLPEPIDLDLDHRTGELYWTDRGAPPKGNTLNRASVHGYLQPEPEILTSGLKEAIGLALDLVNDRAFFGDLGGNLYSSHLDGKERRVLYSGNGVFTGIAYLADGPAVKKG
jgi:hypothetical protein